MNAHGRYCRNSLLQLQKDAIPEGDERGGSLYWSDSDGALSLNRTEKQILFQAYHFTVTDRYKSPSLSHFKLIYFNGWRVLSKRNKYNICLCGCTKYSAYSSPKSSLPTLRCNHSLLFVSTSSRGLKLFLPWLTSKYGDKCNYDVLVLKYSNKYSWISSRLGYCFVDHSGRAV